VEFLSPILAGSLFFIGLVLLSRVLLTRLEALPRKKPADVLLLLVVQQQIDQLHLQFSQILDKKTPAGGRELGQVLYHVTESLTETARFCREGQISRAFSSALSGCRELLEHFGQRLVSAAGESRGASLDSKTE
jgi:hypothetical protein